ncbi:20S proteasome assembly protein [Candida orthopsilosis Co 90-125]|uniref:Proteasome assembly chaperone 2 n=1 Tax=Candida orthopsilosis (strain 90-125) TaxID=1136231 RepID=H8X3A1_CANO9|nr:20S proteasome assembly protein [Candida orthopsilosis Co 90-125]CCG25961.1 20S proteasome assembly protein [Candida orthopsilosis Co 90-125]
MSTSPYIPFDTSRQPDISGSALIVPSISIGNIPQLTIDLIIHTYSLTKIGYLDDLYLYPFASPIDYVNSPSELGINHAIEVYHSSELNITVVQQRSPIIPTYTPTFIQQVLVPFITTNHFESVLILNSSDAGLVESVNSGDIKLYDTEDLISSNLENLSLSTSLFESNDPKDRESERNSRFVTELVKAIISYNGENSSKSINIKVLVSYVYEGDNFYDAEKSATKLRETLQLQNQGDGPVDKWIKPVSWLGVYGDKSVPNAMEEGIFG